MFQVSLRTRDQLTRLAERAGCPWEVQTLTRADDSALGHLERYFFGEGEPYEGDSGAIRVREADTAFSEVEQTAADIRRLVAAGSAATGTSPWPPGTWRTTRASSRRCSSGMRSPPT